MSSASGERNPVEELAEEFAQRLRRGEQPSVEEYVDRFPVWSVQIRDLFPALLAMERLKPQTGLDTGPSAADQTATLPAAPPERLGEYRLLREIGRGGMGVVYEAVQESLGRHVALKVLPGRSTGSASYLERFRREARAAGQLQHPNIVPVFGVGEVDGVHFFAMQFIQGHGLDVVLNDLRTRCDSESATRQGINTPLSPLSVGPRTSLFEPTGATDLPDASAPGHPVVPPPRSGGPITSPVILPRTRGYHTSVARIGTQVAEALAHAHEQGVLHRDIKPSNLLLDSHGTVWVTDFGLAKATDGDDLTSTGEVVGTLRYIPPERFKGESDERGDVYSLGLTLYELLTLRPAFDSVERHRVIEMVLFEQPKPPRELDRTIPRDLETIVLKCVAREPTDRYPSARELADDLKSFLADEPIKARRSSWRERAWRWCRHNPAVAGLSAAVAALLLLLGVGAAVYLRGRTVPEPVEPQMVFADPGSLMLYRAEVGRSFLFQVTGDPSGPVWGSEVYTDDSTLGTVAVHAGLLKFGEEGVVKVTLLPGRTEYHGSAKHGVTTRNYGAFSGSYRVEPTDIRPRPGVQAQRLWPAVRTIEQSPSPGPIDMSQFRGKEGETVELQVRGAITGGLWGTDIYSDDSSVAAAAVHAGILKDGEEGIVRVTILPGQQSYTGSVRHGVVSLNWATFEGSFRFATDKP